MSGFQKQVRDRFPADLVGLGDPDWVPWQMIRRRHAIDRDVEELLSLLHAYGWLRTRLPLSDLAQWPATGPDGGCGRCGTCCAFMRPGPVSWRTYEKWKKKQSPISTFFQRSSRGDPSTYHCWFYNSTRLRMCPLLLKSAGDDRMFCSVHHLGPGTRHPACSGYRAQPPLCRAHAESLGW